MGTVKRLSSAYPSRSAKASGSMSIGAQGEHLASRGGGSGGCNVILL